MDERDTAQQTGPQTPQQASRQTAQQTGPQIPQQPGQGIAPGTEDPDRLRQERDSLLAERERLRQELAEPPESAPRIPPRPTHPPILPPPPGVHPTPYPNATPEGAATTPPPAARRRLLVAGGAALVLAAAGVPAGIALFGGNGGKGRRGNQARTWPGTGHPSPTPSGAPPPTAIPAHPALRPLATLQHKDDVGTFCFSPDGRTLASAEAADGVLYLWDVATHKQRAQPLLSSLGIFRTLAFSPDGRTLATGSEDRAQFWDAATLRPLGKEIATPDDPFPAFEAIAFSPDGKTFATSGFVDTEIRLYDPATRKQKGGPLEQTGPHQLLFSPDGNTLASADEDGMDGVRLWDVATRKQRHKPSNDFFGGTTILAFSRDSKTLAATSKDTDVVFFDATTGRERGSRLAAHSEPVTGLAYSTDGRTVLTADRAGIHLWDAATHLKKADVTGAPGIPDAPEQPAPTRSDGDSLPVSFTGTPADTASGPITQLAFSPDGRTLATIGRDATAIRLWRLE